jgi:hypothetical protein
MKFLVESENLIEEIVGERLAIEKVIKIGLSEVSGTQSRKKDDVCWLNLVQLDSIQPNVCSSVHSLSIYLRHDLLQSFEYAVSV